MDEPSEGLAPLLVREIGRIVGELKRERLVDPAGRAEPGLALALADRVYVMNKGQIVFDGTPAALDANEDVKHHYLGVASAARPLTLPSPLRGEGTRGGRRGGGGSG